MNINSPAKSISSHASQVAENSLASVANEPSDLGFSSMLSAVINPKQASESAKPLEDSSPSSDPFSTKPGKDIEEEKLREAFHNFVGQTFFSQMLSSLRSTQEGAAYFNGGQAEKIFQGQLDQVLSEELTKSSADQIADPMFELFQLQRSR